MTDLLRGTIPRQCSCRGYALEQFAQEVRLLNGAARKDGAAADQGTFCNSVCLSSWNSWGPR